MSAAPNSTPLRLVVLISGGGSNLQSIINAIAEGGLGAVICLVVSNQADAYGLVRAEQAGIPARVLSHRDFADRESFDRALVGIVNDASPDYIVLAGFMRILSAEFISAYTDRILNIHPALLPKFKGTNTHQRALDAGESEHGASVHLVTEALDDGPVLLQARVPVLMGDTAELLQQRVLEQEHVIYPRAIRMLADGRIKISNGNVIHEPVAAGDESK